MKLALAALVAAQTRPADRVHRDLKPANVKIAQQSDSGDWGDPNKR